MTKQNLVTTVLVMLFLTCCLICCWADTTPPSTPVVTDDGTYQASTSQLHATWAACTDPESGIYEYICGITTDPEEECEFESVGLATQATWTGISLASGETYYIRVKAINGESMEGEAGLSDGIVIDSSAPSTPMVTDDGQYTDTATQLHASWSSTDSGSGVAEYQYAIGTSAADPGSGYTVGWTSTATSTEVTKTGLSLTETSTYYFYVKAKNGAATWSTVGVSNGITIDTSAPSKPEVTASRTVLQAGWIANDYQSGIAEYQYAVGTTAGGTDVRSWTSTGTNTSVDTGLTPTSGYTYYISVKAKNGAGSWSAAAGTSKQITPPWACVPTYECLGIYWSPEGGYGAECYVAYRVSGGGWKTGLSLWYDDRNDEYRGSIVGLTEGTSYEIYLETIDASENSLTASFTATTRDDDFPIGTTVGVSDMSTTLAITTSGTANGYRLYEPSGSSATIDVDDASNYCVNIDASYVIVRGLILKDAAQYGIRLGVGVHDVVIEDCEITNWGQERYTGSGFGVDGQAAIFSYQPDIYAITIQRNKIHHPRWDTKNWEEDWIIDAVNGDHMEYNWKHPYGPQAVYLANSLGNNVIRYNEVYSDEDHYFNDCLGANSNFSYKGFPGADSDIYGNYLANCWDDGIESEGGNCNVRIWGNFITYTMTKVAVTPTAIGPVYVWRNIGSYARQSDVPVCWRDDGDDPDPVPATGDPDGWDESSHSVFLKSADNQSSIFRGGRIYLFSNTMLQPTVNGYTAGNSAAVGCGISAPNLVSRNNLFDLSSTYACMDQYNGTGGDFDYDFYDGTMPSGTQSNGIPFAGSEPLYYQTPSYNLTDTNGLLTGIFKLSTSSDGYDEGCAIDSFTDGYLGTAPDMGAHEYGTDPVEFGVKAYE